MNAPDWSNDEFINYYLENQILPASAPSGTENRIFSHSNGIQNHLKGRFSGFDTWEIDYDKSNDVSEKFKGNPIDADEEDPVIDYAKSNSDISGYDAIGCGPLALFTQLDFFARYAGYTQFMTYPDHVIHKSNLYHRYKNAKGV